VIVERLRKAGCVWAEREAELLVAAAHTPAELASMVDRRAGGEPLELVIGWAEFCGLRIAVEPGVFVPRRRTELLVDQATALAVGNGGAPTVIVDLCCGTGAVGAALAADLGEVELWGVDLDPAAVRCARRNMPPGGRVLEGDLFDPLPSALRGGVDLLVANAPYVPTDAIRLLAREARQHERPIAFDGGADGLGVVRRVAAGARRWLSSGGHLLVESSESQAGQTVELFVAGSLTARVVRSDQLDATVVIGALDDPQ
jgi:release factor glutamine methyltransferase